MDPTALRIFRTVAEELSITRAARRLGRAPSNVTARIQQLEETLGVALFVRRAKRLQLSREGDTFLGYATRLLALSEEARQVLHSGRPQGLLRIGTMESAAASRIPEPLARYHRRWPRVKIRLTTGPSRQMLEALQVREVDCALVALPVGARGDGEFDLSAAGLAGLPVFPEELMLVLPEDHPAVHCAKDIEARSLAAFPQGCTYRAMAESWLGEAGRSKVVPIDIQEVGSYHAMLACVASGTSVSFVPKSVIELAAPAGIRTMPVAHVDTWLVWRQGGETPALGALRDLLA